MRGTAHQLGVLSGLLRRVGIAGDRLARLREGVRELPVEIVVRRRREEAEELFGAAPRLIGEGLGSDGIGATEIDEPAHVLLPVLLPEANRERVHRPDVIPRGRDSHRLGEQQRLLLFGDDVEAR